MRRGRTAVAAVLGVLMPLLLGGGTGHAVQTAQDRIVNVNPEDWTPHAVDGRVYALVQVGNRIIAGGTFTTVKQRASDTAGIPREKLFAFDATTGAIDPNFKPVVNDGEVQALLPGADGTSVYVAGSFNTVNGVTARKLTRLSLADGKAVAGFKPPTLGQAVYDVRMAGGQLLIGGAFTKVGTTVRSGMASLHPDTGALTSYLNVPFTEPRFGGTMKVLKFDITPDGKRLVALGNFTRVGGQSRTQVAMLDLGATAAQVGTWATARYEDPCLSGAFDTYVRDVDFSPDGSYFVVSTTGAFGGGASSGTLCDTITRWETAATGNDPTWTNYTGGDTTYGVAVTAASV